MTVFIALFTSYYALAKNYSKEVVIEEFTTALLQEDHEKLQELISPSDSRLKINNQSLAALFELIDQEPSLIQDIESSLHNKGLGSNLFLLRKDGKHYGIFQRFTIDTTGYFIKINNPGIETTVHLNDNEIGVVEQSKETMEFGPFIAGSYDLQLTYTEEGAVTEERFPLLLSGTKTSTEIAVNYEPPVETEEETIEEKEEEKEEPAEEKKETVIIKEVIKEVPAPRPTPSYNYYLSPHSAYSYLSYSDIAGFSKSDLRIARNEIFARYGYVFQSADLQNYFYSQHWYTPNPNYNGHLSEVEQYNVEFIKSYE